MGVNRGACPALGRADFLKLRELAKRPDAIGVLDANEILRHDGCMAKQTPLLNLVVIRAADPARTRRFYTAISLTFVSEQHGTGPMHDSCTLGSTVLEIYPLSPVVGNAPTTVDASTRLGFQVASLDTTIEALIKAEVEVIVPAKDSPWGRRAVVRDPDGRSVELTMCSPASNRAFL